LILDNLLEGVLEGDSLHFLSAHAKIPHIVRVVLVKLKVAHLVAHPQDKGKDCNGQSSAPHFPILSYFIGHRTILISLLQGHTDGF
jgi:hypothetical protein